jgi:hypothetical protein
VELNVLQRKLDVEVIFEFGGFSGHLINELALGRTVLVDD